MPTTAAPPSPRLVRALVGLGILILALVAGLAFLLGRKSVAWRERRQINAFNRGETLLGALRAANTPPAELAGILRVYRRPEEDVEWLDTISWVPPPIPAPFIGHMARPGNTANARINAFGFRDDRTGYPRVVGGRVFITGGSAAYGTGAPDQRMTIAGRLEERLAKRMPNAAVEVVNAAYPAWSTTQERLLITQRLAFLTPRRIIMLSGNNDVHWALAQRDAAWFLSYADEHFIQLIDEAYWRAGLGGVRATSEKASERRACREVAALAAYNVRLAVEAAALREADLVFALQPNLHSTAKSLSPREMTIRARAGNAAYWEECYAELRTQLSAIDRPNYRFLDLSGLFADLGANQEVFIDSYHVGSDGNDAVARALEDALSWK